MKKLWLSLAQPSLKCADQASPVAAPGAPFDVVNVSDFDGEFVGAGVPGQHSNAALALEATRSLFLGLWSVS